MAVEKIYQGSTLELEISLTQADGSALNPNSVDDVIVLFRYKDGRKGTLQKFKKVASGAILAWTAPDADEGKLVCEVPASVMSTAYPTSVVVEMKVVKEGQYEYVTVLENEFLIESSNLADD